jgi:ABC-type branched-subunit amino acid transport system permease subunit
LATSIRPRTLLSSTVFAKWIVALLVPVLVFTFGWNGDLIVNRVLSGFLLPGSSAYDTVTLIQAAFFVTVFYLTTVALAGYLVASDSGRRGMVEVWVNILIFVLVPLGLVIYTNNLIFGLALCALIWAVYLYGRRLLLRIFHYTPPPPLEELKVIDAEQQVILRSRAIAGSFWFAVVLAVIWLIADLFFYTTGTLSFQLLIWGIIRTILLPVAGYFLGQLAALIALRRVITPAGNGGNERKEARGRVSRRRQLEVLSTARASEEAKDLVPNDLPLRSTGAQRFYLLLLIAFVLFYPALDPLLFGSGTAGRLAGYGDAGFYVILALGLNIVVGFAGLLDLGYVAFFAIGSYAWGILGSPQIGVLAGFHVNPQIWPWFFWPMILGAALIAAFWGVVLGTPTLRLRGDYLAIVTLGFGEIVPIVFLELDKYTNGTNGLVSVYSPAFPGVDWSANTPIPYYYLILALIVLTLFANLRLRDSRLGRAWVAIREDEIAAASSGINLVNTKLFAFGAGAFFSGIAGMYHAAKLGTVSPDNFSFGDSVIYLAMVVIGGIGSIPGVIVGALVVYSINLFVLNQLDTIVADPSNGLYYVLNPIYTSISHFVPGFTFGSIRNLVFGIVLVVIMVFRPEGLIPSARRRRELHRAADEAAEVGSLDVAPGAPGFESEVRID